MSVSAAQPASAGAPADAPAEASGWRRFARPAYALGVRALSGLTFVLYVAVALVSWTQFRYGYDLAIFDQAVRRYAHFQSPITPMLGAQANLLGEHFSPVVALWAPLYWIWSDPRMLMVGQAALIALSVPVVCRFARRRFSDGAALLLGAAYAVGWPLQGMSAFDVHEIAFAVPLLALALDALDRRDDRMLLVWGLALLSVREDMGLVLVVIGLVRALRPGRRWWGAVVAGAGVAGYLAATALLIPRLAAHGSWRFWSYDALGPDLPTSVVSVLTHPLHAAELFVSPGVKAITLVMLLAPIAFVALRSPYSLVVLPLLAERFWSSRESLWLPTFHYSAIAWVVLFLAAVDGASRLRPRAQRVAPRAILGASAVCAVVGVALVPMVFPVGWLLHPADRATAAGAADRATLIAQIPAGTCVGGDVGVASHLLDTNLTGYPQRMGVDPDFVVVDLDAPPAADRPSVADTLSWVAAHGYARVDQAGTVVLYRSPAYAGPRVACRPG